MKRLILVLCLFLMAMPVQAAKLAPPLNGDMAKLEQFDEPQYLPEILLSRSPEGLAYLAEFRGKFLVVNLWATWCPPCLNELPSLNALQLAMGSDDFQVVTVSFDRNDPAIVKKFLEDHNWKNLTPLIDANNDMQKLDFLKDVPAIPVTIFVDRKLRAIARFQGETDWNGPDTRKVLEYYLANTDKF